MLRPCERLLYKLTGVDEKREMRWTEYAIAMLLFSGVSMALLYVIERVQQWLPWNPQKLAAVPTDLAFNTAASFTTNTNWQAYVPEVTMSYFTQMAGLAYHNFMSAAVGIALAIAVIRGIARREQDTIGNFWVDLTRTILWVLLPVCLVVSMIFVSQGVIQNLRPYTTTQLVDPQTVQVDGRRRQDDDASGEGAGDSARSGGVAGGHQDFRHERRRIFQRQQLASLRKSHSADEFSAARVDFRNSFGADLHAGADDRVAAARLGGVGRDGGAVPGGRDFGVQRRRRGEIRCCTAWTKRRARMQPGGNMEGKEVRFGIANTALYATVTTDASCGAVNGMHDSFTPLGGMIPLINIMLGEVVFGGVGSGLYGMIVFVILSVFIAGLMVGRTPEYLGKKIEAYDVKMAMLSVLIFPLVILTFTAISVVAKSFGTPSITNPGPHGLSQILYAYTSGTGNNGSAFAGFNANTLWYNTTIGLATLVWAIFRGDSDSGDCGKPGAEEIRAGIGGHVSGDDAAVYGAAGFRGADRERADIFPGAEPGTDSGASADARGKGVLRTHGH